MIQPVFHRTSAGLRRVRRRSCARCVVLAVLVTNAHAAAIRFEWPQFRGPERNGISRETGLLREWPEAGPPVAWQVDGVGGGFSSPIVAGGALYISGDRNDVLVISSFDLNGNLRWETENGRAWKGPYRGARGTCTYHQGRIFHINAHGRVVCLDADEGRVLWTLNMLDCFGSENIHWGISECPLVDRNEVIVTPGGGTAMLAALRPATGSVLWTSPPLTFRRTHAFGGKAIVPPRMDSDRTGYSSPVMVDVGGRRLIAGCSARHYFLVDRDTHEIVWTHAVDVRFEVIGAIPLVHGKSVLFMAPDVGGILVDVTLHDGSIRVREQWETRVDNCHGAFVRWRDRLVGAGYRLFPGWACIDAGTGETLHEMRDAAKGSIAYADERFYALSERGTLSLIELTGDRLVARGRVSISDGKRGDAWAHPVICNGNLYLRYHDTLTCYDIRRTP